MTLDKLAISVEGKELALIDGMALDGGSTLTQDGKGVNSQVNYTVNSLKLQGQDMGSGKLTLKVDNVDGQAWHQFSQQYSAQSQALLAKPELAQNPELYQQALTETLFNALPILLKGNPSVTISPLSWRNAKGESTLNLSVLLKDPAQVTAPPQTLADSLDRAVQSLDGKVVIPVDMATEFMTKSPVWKAISRPMPPSLPISRSKAWRRWARCSALPPWKITPSAAVCSTRTAR